MGRKTSLRRPRAFLVGGAVPKSPRCPWAQGAGGAAGGRSARGAVGQGVATEGSAQGGPCALGRTLGNILKAGGKRTGRGVT